MPLYPGSPFHIGFTTRRASTAASFNTSSTVAILFKNTVADGAVALTVTQAYNTTPLPMTGTYFVSGTIPPVGYAAGDSISIWVGVIVDGVADGEFVMGFVLGSSSPAPSLTADDVWDEDMGESETAREIMRVVRALVAGDIDRTNNGDGTFTVKIKSADGLVDRVVGTLDLNNDGDRTVTGGTF